MIVIVCVCVCVCESVFTLLLICVQRKKVHTFCMQNYANKGEMQGEKCSERDCVCVCVCECFMTFAVLQM